MASSSTTSSLAFQPCKYDVFLSFNGEDTRRNFISHLYAALCQKDLQTFFDNNELKRGEQIARSLPQAIKDSTVAVLVFSKNYALSTWCLDELVKIIKCHETHGQIIIPIFYEIDPSHLRKQSHDVAAALVKHEQNPKNGHKIRRWRDALTKASNLCGFDSKDFSTDHMLINKIVEEILEKLNQSMTWDDFENLVGMNSRIQKIKQVFTIKPLEVCILGIWGMGGVGKTTLAKVIYNMMSHQFEGCCFVYNIRQQAEGGRLMNLLEELVSKALGEENPVKRTFIAGPTPFLKARLGRKKMLILLDDVDDSQQIESLIGDPCWFGSESVILITSRDKQVFRGRTDFIYEVELLNDDEALQLFTMSAFKQKNPRDDYVSLSDSIVKYAQGNPLALKVLGSSLIGKKEKEWERAINQLSEVPNMNIQSALQVSYNGLNRVEKDVFLDIACFFKHVWQTEVNTNILRQIYKNSRFNIDIILTVLVDKCLVTVSTLFNHNMLQMHDLLQEMGKEIVRQESKYPNRRTRLWDHEDIYKLFVENKEAEVLESIMLNVSKIKEINLNSKVFMKMPNLKFIYFNRSMVEKSNLHLLQGLDYLPNKIRYLYWDKYPLESLPPNFQPENLAILRLPNSNIKEMHTEVKENSVASQYTNGILSTIVNSFCSLIKVPSIYGSPLGKLRSLSFVNNKSITLLPNSRSGLLEALEVLDLGGCKNLNAFPEISSSIKELILSETAIKHVPSSSVELLSKLKKLEMRCCRELESLSSNFLNKLTSLEKLDLTGSSRFKELPGILEPMYNLKRLVLKETAMEKLPSSIGNLKGLVYLDITDCRKLVYLPESFNNAIDLQLSKCNFRELPEDLNFLYSAFFLYLGGNNFERIPAAIKQLSQLKCLDISECKRLKSLPELPSGVFFLNANGCTSLEEIWTLKQVHLDSRKCLTKISLRNCLKLDEDECQEAANALLRNHLIAFTRNQMQKPLENFEMIYPGNRIPEWVKYQSMGDSIQIHLSSLWLNHLFLGFAFYLCYDERFEGFLRYDCYLGDSYQFSSGNFVPQALRIEGIDTEHMMVFMSSSVCEWGRRHGNFEEGLAFFKFSGTVANGIKKCGVIPLYAQKDEDGFCVNFDFPTSRVSKLKRSATSTQSFHYMPEKRLKMEEVE